MSWTSGSSKNAWIFKAKGLTQEHQRQAVIHTKQKLNTSERRTCKVLEVARSTLNYKMVQNDDDVLRLAMMRLAKAYDRFGYWKITQLLQNKYGVKRGCNCHSVTRNESRCHKDSSITRLRTQHSIYIWSIHFVHDKLTNRLRYKILTVIDEYTRGALCVAVKPKMNANDVLDVLFDLILKRGKPRIIRSVNSPEFIAENLQTWLKKVGIVPIQIHPGSPWECGG